MWNLPGLALNRAGISPPFFSTSFRRRRWTSMKCGPRSRYRLATLKISGALQPCHRLLKSRKCRVEGAVAEAVGQPLAADPRGALLVSRMPDSASVDVAPEAGGDPVLQLLNVPDTAERLGVSVRTVRRMIADGELPCVRLRDRVLIRSTDIAALVESNVERRDPQVAAA